MKRRLFLFATPLALSACGFRLKGSAKPFAVDGSVALVLESKQDAVERAIRDAFAERGITLERGTSAVYQIRLSDFVDSRFESAVGGQYGQSRVLDLHKGFTATIMKDGKTLASQPLASDRSINYHSEQYLGNLADDEAAQRAMLRDNAENLLRFFQATLARQ